MKSGENRANLVNTPANDRRAGRIRISSPHLSISSSRSDGAPDVWSPMRFDALYQRRNAFQGRAQRLTRFRRIVVGLQPYPEAIAQGEDA